MAIEWVPPAVAVLVLIWGMVTRGRLIALQQTAVQAWMEVDELLRRRHQLVSRLVEAVPAPGKRERKALDLAKAAMGRAATAETPGSIAKAEEALTAAIAAVFEVAAENPDVVRLRAELSAIENRILSSARHFNEVAQDYNEARMGFSGVLIAYVTRFDVLEYYKAANASSRAQRPDPADRDRDAGLTLS
jgi:LemA protein